MDEKAHGWMQAVFEHAPDAMLVHDAGGRFVEVNRRACESVGYSRDALLHMSVEDVAPALGDVEAARREWARLAPGAASTQEGSLRHRDGRVFPVEVRFACLEAGGRKLFVALARDITDRKVTDERFRLGQDRLALAVRSTGAGVWDWDIAANRIVWDEPMLRLYGLTREQFSGDVEAWSAGVHPDDRERAGAELRAALDGVRDFDTEFRVRRPDGTVRHVKADGLVLRDASGAPARMIGLNRDVSDRRSAEEELRKTQELLSTVYRNSDIGIYVVSVSEAGEYRYEGINPTHERLMGVPNAAVVGRGPEALGAYFPPEVVAYVRGLYDTCVRTRETLESEFHVEAGPAKGWWLSRLTPIVDPETGRVVRLMGNGLPITARREAEDTLRRERERLQNILEGTRAGTWEWNVQTGDLVVDETWAEMVGRTLAEVSPTSRATWVSLVHPDDVARSDEIARRHLAGVLPCYECEFRMRHRDGHWVWILGRGRVITRGADGAPLKIFGTQTDVTDRKRAEEERARLQAELHHAHKMEAIGALAGGVAHDFNNILTGIMGGLSLLEEHATDGAEIREMKALVRRGADLSRQLLGFARGGKYDVRPLDLAQVAQVTATLFGRTHRDVTVVSEFAPDLHAVLMDHSQLEQVLLNLFINAGQAMPGGGRLLLRGENVVLGEAETAPLGAAPGSFVKLVVADTGVGMDAATRQRIFEPFFTTKPAGAGTGLGLASVYGIVKNHGGLITVESEPGRGAAFTVLLPATERRTEAPASVEPRPAAGQGTILVVDDEAPVARVCARILSRLGYEVLTASGGREAIRLVGERGDRLSLVILDMTMPDLSGAQTFEALRAIAPRLKVLLSTGYSADGQARELMARGCDGFIQKPFDATTLSVKVESVLKG